MPTDLIQSIENCFGDLPDPRVRGCCDHELLDIIMIAICGVLCDADSWAGIETVGKVKEIWFRQFLKLEHGIPSHDTFGDVFAKLDHDEFQRRFISWVESVLQQSKCQSKKSIMQIRKTYKYRLFKHEDDKHLHHSINIAGLMWNYCIAFQKRYRRLFGGYVSQDDMQARLKKRQNSRRYAFRRALGSQAMQDVAERVHKAHKKFFSSKGGVPRFKKVKKYKSFTLKKNAGWKLGEDSHHRGTADNPRCRGHVKILERWYKFVKSREIKTVTVKRDPEGNLWICFSVETERGIITL